MYATVDKGTWPEIKDKESYTHYRAVVADFLEANELTTLWNYQEDREGHYSWRPCECCNRPWGGERYDIIILTNDGKCEEFSVCMDCVYYLEYGRLDDTTMMEVNGG